MAGGVVVREVDTELDLNAAVAKAAGQRAVIAPIPSQPARVVMPGQPHSSRQAPEKKEPRKPRRHGFARQRMTPTRRVEQTAGLT